MAEAIIMPRQGQSVETCIFSEWFKKKGDKVSKGDLLFAYETDKAEFEQEATADGILLDTFVQEGDEVPVLQVIGVIGQEGESVDEFRPAEANGDATREASGTSETAPPKTETFVDETDRAPQHIPEGAEGESKISPRAKNLAEKHNLDLSAIKGSGPYGRIIEDDVKKALEEKPKATPLAKAIAARENIELPQKGSGYGGRILAADVKIIPSVALTDDYQDVKLSNVRKIIAKNMYESLANTAQLTLHASADARRMLDYRKKIKAKMAEGYNYNITINDMVSFAVVKALLKQPEINAHFQGETIRYFKNVHLGFAVDTSRGLLVPVVKNANHLRIEGLSSQLKELAANCQAGNINPEMLQGATFTLTNLGAYGIEMFTPVLNPPQAGILGVNTITYQPADVGGGVIGFVPRIGLSLTFDHRSLDGAPAAAFLKEVSLQIENIELDI